MRYRILTEVNELGEFSYTPQYKKRLTFFWNSLYQCRYRDNADPTNPMTQDCRFNVARFFDLLDALRALDLYMEEQKRTNWRQAHRPKGGTA